MSTIIIKHNSVATEAPTASDLVEGELAVNTVDGTLYVGTGAGVTELIGSGVGGGLASVNQWTALNTFTGGMKSEGASSNSFRAGTSAGDSAQGSKSVAVGNQAGETTQDSSAVAVGDLAGNDTQGYATVAIGRQAGETTQSNYGVAIGNQAGETTQGQNSIAIGRQAGQTTQGSNAIALGFLAAGTTQHTTSIVINATGSVANTVDVGDIAILSSAGGLTMSGATGDWTNTGNWTSTGDLTANSDSRLKKDVEPIENALDKVDAITGVTFSLIAGDEARRTGVIAQDVQAVLPEAVHTDENGLLSVAYGNLVGLAFQAIKELRAEVAELKGEK